MIDCGTSKLLSSRVYESVRATLLVAIVGYLAWQIYAGRSALASLRPDWDALTLAGAFLSAVVAYQCLVLGWLLLLRRSGHYAEGRLRQYLRIWWVSYLYRYVPGKVLLVVERSRLGVAVDIPPVVGAALTVVETLLAILAGVAVSLFAVFYHSADDGRMLGGVVILAGAAIFIFPPALRWLCRIPALRSRHPELESVEFGYSDILISIIPYLFHYLLLGLSFSLVSRGLHAFSWSAMLGLCGVYALSHVISLVALLAPGGLGVREGALAVQLGRTLPTGIAEALAIGIRVWFTAVELISYAAVLLFCPAASSSES